MKIKIAVALVGLWGAMPLSAQAFLSGLECSKSQIQDILDHFCGTECKQDICVDASSMKLSQTHKMLMSNREEYTFMGTDAQGNRYQGWALFQVVDDQINSRPHEGSHVKCCLYPRLPGDSLVIRDNNGNIVLATGNVNTDPKRHPNYPCDFSK